jgi:hypothetical protein
MAAISPRRHESEIAKYEIVNQRGNSSEPLAKSFSLASVQSISSSM